MTYVDGFLVPVRHDQRDAYIEVARTAAAVFREYGALGAVECWGDDIADGKVTDFRRAVAAEPDETVVFSWIMWPSREARDRGNAALMADERMKDMPMPFDGKRMIFGGFETIVDTSTSG